MRLPPLGGRWDDGACCIVLACLGFDLQMSGSDLAASDGGQMICRLAPATPPQPTLCCGDIPRRRLAEADTAQAAQSELEARALMAGSEAARLSAQCARLESQLADLQSRSATDLAVAQSLAAQWEGRAAEAEAGRAKAVEERRVAVEEKEALEGALRAAEARVSELERGAEDAAAATQAAQGALEQQARHAESKAAALVAEVDSLKGEVGGCQSFAWGPLRLLAAACANHGQVPAACSDWCATPCQ